MCQLFSVQVTTIKILSYHDRQDSPVQRTYTVSCANMIDYLADSLVSIGYDVQIISNAKVVEPKFKIYRGSNEEIRPGVRLKSFPSWGGNKLKFIKLAWHLVALFFYLITHTRRDEPVIVHHHLGYYKVILWAKRIRKFRLILNVCEIYQLVSELPFRALNEIEYKTFENGDAFILCTDSLNERINKHSRPYIVMSCLYKTEPEVVDKFDDGKIHLLYAGTFEVAKGGVNAAIRATEYLPENYHLHVLGFGTEAEIGLVKETIAEVSARSKASITYEGLKRGRDYIEFVQRCHIGLSTQDPTGTFNDTSYPSKLFSYLSNGLKVVTVDLPVIRQSPISDSVFYIEEYTPQAIAHAIEAAARAEYVDGRAVIKRIDTAFVASLKRFIESQF